MTEPRPPRADGVDWADIDKPGEFGMTARERDEWFAAAQTPPAADGGLPGPLPWRTVPFGVIKLVKDDNDKTVFTFPYDQVDKMEDFVAWINAQAARLVEKDAAYDGMLTSWAESRQRHLAAEAQLATATERLASAEAVVKIADFMAAYPPAERTRPGSSKAYVLWDDLDKLRAALDEYARAWLTSKDGEKQP